jgi:hypothetical protein
MTPADHILRAVQVVSAHPSMSTANLMMAVCIVAVRNTAALSLFRLYTTEKREGVFQTFI